MQLDRNTSLKVPGLVEIHFAQQVEKIKEKNLL